MRLKSKEGCMDTILGLIIICGSGVLLYLGLIQKKEKKGATPFVDTLQLIGAGGIGLILGFLLLMGYFE